jgi:SpoVK/Ycf46/Vps4 family AAA+-type ATPase
MCSCLIDLLDVEHLAEPEISEDAIDRLVMNEKSKSAIKAIVKTYTDRDDSLPRGDFIHGKGEGQVILLHGPPGTGT